MFCLKRTHGGSANAPALETQINQLIYKLYDLTEEEIKIIKKCFLVGIFTISKNVNLQERLLKKKQKKQLEEI